MKIFVATNFYLRLGGKSSSSEEPIMTANLNKTIKSNLLKKGKAFDLNYARCPQWSGLQNETENYFLVS